MLALRKLFSFAATSLAVCLSAVAHAEVWTASFTGIAYGYNNHGPYAPQNPNFIRVASGSLVFDPSQMDFDDYFNVYSGPGIELNFKIGNYSVTYGGIGDSPDTMPEGRFYAASSATRQSATFVAGNSGCGSLCTANLVLAGPLGAFGPADLTPETFRPGRTFFDGSSRAWFGNRDVGATIYLTSIRFTPSGSVGVVPEPSTYAMMLASLALLACASRYRHRVAVIMP